MLKPAGLFRLIYHTGQTPKREVARETQTPGSAAEPSAAPNPQLRRAKAVEEFV